MRYFLEVAYKGTNYAGFQIQENAKTIQSELENALKVYFKQHLPLTGSSRTDAGVHALQNFLHFDYDDEIKPRTLYNLNAILPAGITIKAIHPVSPDRHCRFDAISREYRYYIYDHKNPFLNDRAWFYPYTLNVDLLHQAAVILQSHHDFTSFAKRNSQVFTHQCTIYKSQWLHQDECLVYNVEANRFLRGMVRGLVSTMLQVGRGKINLHQFQEIILAKDCTKASFSTPPHGLFLCRVKYSFLP